MCRYVKFRFSYRGCHGLNKPGCGYVVEKSVSKCTTALLCVLKETYVVEVRDLQPWFCPRCAAERGFFKVEDPMPEWKSSLRSQGISPTKLIKDLERCAISGEGIEEVWKEFFENGDRYLRTGPCCCVVS